MKILLLAGEASGVLYAERLKRSLAEFAGGRAIEYRGYDTEGFRIEDLAVMGFVAVLKRLPYFLRVARTMARVVDTWRPDVVVTIDYPGLNLKLARRAKARGIPAVHVVCPQVWAWHQDRIPKVAASLTKLLCFFPFEPALFGPPGTYGAFRASFIGHPMVDVFAEEDRNRAADGVAPGGDGVPLLAVLPGSRSGEIARNLPRLIETVRLLRDRGQAFRVEIPAASARSRAHIEALVAAGADALRGVDVRIRLGGAREVLRRARCAAVASGTATLEAALARCPTVLVYAVSWLFATFLRHAIRQIRHVGLANIVWEKSLPDRGVGRESPMPELLQEAFTPEAVADRLEAWLRDPAARAAAVKRLDEAMALLHSDGDALGLAAREVLAEVRT